MAYYKQVTHVLTAQGMKAFACPLPQYSNVPNYFSYPNANYDIIVADGYDITSLYRQPGTTTLYTLKNGISVKYIGDDNTIRFYNPDNTPLKINNHNTYFTPYTVYASDLNRCFIAIVRMSLDNETYYTNVIAITDHNARTGRIINLNDAMSSNQAWGSWDYSILLNDSIAGPDPYSTVDEPSATGGYGDYNYTGDPVDHPTAPTVSASQAGFVSLYNPTSAEVAQLAAYMWSGAFDLATYKKIFADPMDCIIGFGIVPIAPDTGAAVSVKTGNINTGINMKPITNQFKEIDCGSINVNGQTASNLDYSPYTKAEIYLPFIGIRNLNIDDIMDSTVSLKYIFDIFTGACGATIKCTKANMISNGKSIERACVLYQFTGNCMSEIPLTGQNWSQAISTAISAAVVIGGAVASTIATEGAAAPAAAGAVSKEAVATSAAMVSAGASAVTHAKPTFERSGSCSGTAGFLGSRVPYLILTEPNLCRPFDYNTDVGQPSYLSETLSDLSGFTIVHEVHLTGLTCTDQERAMIEAALKSGVFLGGAV